MWWVKGKEAAKRPTVHRTEYLGIFNLYSFSYHIDITVSVFGEKMYFSLLFFLGNKVM